MQYLINFRLGGYIKLRMLDEQGHKINCEGPEDV